MRACLRPGPPSALVLGLLVLTTLPGGGNAQELGINCDLIDYRVWTGDNVRGIHYLGRPTLICPDGTRIQADSAVVYDATARTEMIGSVRLDHPERTLRAAYADFHEREDRLFAHGSVDFRDLTQGTQVRGDTLTFLEGGTVRLNDEMNVSGTPAVAFLVAGEDRARDAPTEPYRVSASRIRTQGDRYFWAAGQARIEREALEATSDSLVFDNQVGALILTGSARLQQDDLDVAGDRINLSLPGDVIEAVDVVGNARLLGSDLEVTGDELRLTLVGEQVQRMVAVRREDAEAGTGAEPKEDGVGRTAQPRLIAEALFAQGDSIDVNAPGEVLETVVAAGNARVETRPATREGTPPAAPAPSPEVEAQSDEELSEAERLLTSLSTDDWMEGQLIVASFARHESAGPEASDPDSLEGAPSAEEPEYRIDRLTATGNARSWYRAPPEREDPALVDRRHWAISYLLADGITVHFSEGEVDWIEAIGTVRGWQAEPDARPGADTGATTTEDRE